MLVDTSVILDIIDGVEAAVEKEQEREAANVVLVIPSMAVLEPHIGSGRIVDTPEQRQTVEAVLDSYPLVDMTPSVSRRAGA